jgi:LacI family transcriptional regulator
MPATIKDVARAAGCSIKTVSRVINNEPHVSEETRSRVLAAVRSVGYAPNIAARRLVQNRSFMISILMYPGFLPTDSPMLGHIMDIGYAENYDISVQPYFPTHAKSRDRLVNAIYERRFDGFVTTPPCDAGGFVAELLNTYKVPLVQVNPLDRSTEIPYVADNDYQGAYLLTEHLIQLGHRRIAFLRGPHNMRSSVDRLEGYHAALAAHQITRDDDQLVRSESTFDGGRHAANILLKRSAPPTAIFAGSDEAAFGVLFTARELGVEVPAQLSVCGYDDLSVSKAVWPGLTTTHQPAAETIARAVRMLIAILQEGDLPESQIIIPPELVIRGTTAPPPG